MRIGKRGGGVLCGRAFLALLLTAAAACDRAQGPVARVRVESRQITLPWPQRRVVPVDLDLLTELPVDAGPPRLFVHLLRGDGDIVRTFDHELEPEWWPGDRIRVPVVIEQSALADRLPAGRYRLVAGLYDLRFGRYAIERAADGVVVREVDMGPVEVPAESPAVRLAVVSGWLAPLRARDKQVLGALPLAPGGSGVLRLGPLATSLRVFLTMAIRGVDQDVPEIELDDPAGVQHLTVSSDCLAEPVSVAGAGVQEAVLLLPAGRDACELRFAVDYRRRSGRGEEPGAILQAISWRRPEP